MTDADPPPAPAPSASQGSSSVYVGNLPLSTTDEDLEAHFSKYGPISSLRRVTTVSGRCRGFAFVDYAQDSSAAAAIKAVNMTEFKGLTITVQRPRRRWGDDPHTSTARTAPPLRPRHDDRDYDDRRRYDDRDYDDRRRYDDSPPRRDSRYSDPQRRDDRYDTRDRSPPRLARPRYGDDYYRR
jgi:RNA recognition motif-containing protein